MNDSTTRRTFLQAIGVGAAAVGLQGSAYAQQKKKTIQDVFLLKNYLNIKCILK